ncbi:MAG: hydrolase, partial [Candidatus Saccharibacteria bacterium]|nr:hydrolase [Candidatus Saccharibacteria bacterium]
MNPENLREIERDIASALIFSADGYLLMGRKDPSSGGVYPDAWHIPGGGVEPGESLKQAAIREVEQEVGLKLEPSQLKPVATGTGATAKTLPSGERVWCKMTFHRFVAHLNLPKDQLQPRPGDDLVELAWYSPQDLKHVQQIP